MVLNYNNRIIQNFLRRQKVPPKSILSLSANPLDFTDFTDLKIVHFYQQGLLPFDSQSFDFIYCRDPLKIFQNPCQMYAELLRVGRRGLVQNKSPLELILTRPQGSQAVFWTDVFSNTLCYVPYYNQVAQVVDTGDWDRTCLHKPYFLSDWYSWESSSELNIKLHTSFEDMLDYQLLYEEAICESVKNTINVLGKVVNKPDNFVYINKE